MAVSLTADERHLYGATLLRVSLGVVWIAHALLKWFSFTIAGFATWLEGQGLPGFMAWPVFTLELVGGVALLLGVYGRLCTAVLLPVLLVATWTHIGNGWVFTQSGGGWEYPVFLVVASVVHLLIGDGRLRLKT